MVPGGGRDHHLSAAGVARLAALELDSDYLLRSRRIFARDCLDWTARQPHLAGALPAALLQVFLARSWLAHKTGRCLTLDPTGWQAIQAWATSPVNDAGLAPARQRGDRQSP